MKVILLGKTRLHLSVIGGTFLAEQLRTMLPNF